MPKPRVLAVDDQRDSLRLLQLRLVSAGMDCHGFNDPAEALAHLEAHPIDLIILDVMMPQMDGYEVCRRIKLNEKLRDIPVLFLTAKYEMEDKVRGLEVGGHDYLTKPVEQQELLARTRAALRVKHLQDELRQKLELQEQLNKLHQGMLSEHWQKTFGQLAASLAHEINNPLAAAIGSIQLLTLEANLAPDALSRLNLVDRSLQRAGQKLRSLLLIAQAGRMVNPISLGQLLDDLVAIINYQVVMNKVTLHTHCDPTARGLKAPCELARALLYILNNAIEAVSCQPEAAIWLRLEAAAKGAVISIADNGPGMPAENLDKVMAPFFTTKTAPHHGVGLYLAREIVHAAGGTIELKSPGANGLGAEVRVTIPPLAA